MCDLCLTAPCAIGCPNAESRPIADDRCPECGEHIRSGDEYVKTPAGDYHLECLECLSTKDLIKLLDYDIKEGEIDYE